MGHRTGIRRSLRSAALVAILVAATATTSGAQAAPRVSARAAVVMDAADGELLWASNPDLMLPPASTTKILTTLLALESGRLDESFRVSANAAETPPSKINLRPGQRMRLKPYATNEQEKTRPITTKAQMTSVLPMYWKKGI
jgi:D-alanyl-D-alanine carboxypeptidase (penicillin-binding protein 5/6)